MSSSVKYSKNGITAEILCKQGTVQAYRSGQLSINKVLLSDSIYRVKGGKKTKSGELSTAEFEEMFGSISQQDAVKQILNDGECPLTTNEMRELRKQKRNEVITYIIRTFLDARGHGFTFDAVDYRLTQKKVVIDYRKNASLIFEENRKKIEGADFILKRKPGVKQTICVAYKNYGVVQSALNKYIVNENTHSRYAEITIDVPPGDTDRVLKIVDKYEYHPLENK